MIFAHRKARLLYQMSNLINSQSLIQHRDKSVLLVGGVAYETGDRE